MWCIVGIEHLGLVEAFRMAYRRRMNDELSNPGDYLRARLEHVLALLDRQELSVAAAFVAQAINAIPANDDR